MPPFSAHRWRCQRSTDVRCLNVRLSPPAVRPLPANNRCQQKAVPRATVRSDILSSSGSVQPCGFSVSKEQSPLSPKAAVQERKSTESLLRRISSVEVRRSDVGRSLGCRIHVITPASTVADSMPNSANAGGVPRRREFTPLRRIPRSSSPVFSTVSKSMVIGDSAVLKRHKR